MQRLQPSASAKSTTEPDVTKKHDTEGVAGGQIAAFMTMATGHRRFFAIVDSSSELPCFSSTSEQSM